MKLVGIIDEKYRYVKTKKLCNMRCEICKYRHDYYRTFYRLNTCNHLVHKDCYKTYKSNKCPKCNKELYKKGLPIIYEGYQILVEEV